jgi:hypothetical protein
MCLARRWPAASVWMAQAQSSLAAALRPTKGEPLSTQAMQLRVGAWFHLERRAANAARRRLRRSMIIRVQGAANRSKTYEELPDQQWQQEIRRFAGISGSSSSSSKEQRHPSRTAVIANEDDDEDEDEDE